MGDWDTYCALCGIYVGGQPEPREDAGRENAPDAALLERNGLEWMADARILGFNSEALYLKKAFLTGRASYSMYGCFDVHEPAEHPDIVPEDLDHVSVYGDGSGETKLPFHYGCLIRIFSTVLFARGVHALPSSVPKTAVYGIYKNIDLDLFYETCRAIGHVPYQSHLNLNYGEQEAFLDQYYFVDAGHEYLWSDPWASIDALQVHLNSVATSDSITEPDTKFLSSPSAKCDSFAKLPSEIMTLVMLDLNHKDVCRWRIASKAAASVSLSTWYWRRRLSVDAPWIVFGPEWQTLKHPDQMSTPRWKQIYQDVHDFSQSSSPRIMHQLASRRRIWDCCSQVADQYIPRAEQFPNVPPPVFLSEHVTPSVFPRVCWPSSQTVGTRTTFFTDSLEEIASLDRALAVGGAVIDPTTGLVRDFCISLLDQTKAVLSIRHMSTESTKTLPYTEATLEPGDWIVGVEIILDYASNKQPIPTDERAHRNGERLDYTQGGIVGIIFCTLHGKRVVLGKARGSSVRFLHAPDFHVVAGFQTVGGADGIQRLGALYARVERARANAQAPHTDMTELTWARMPPGQAMRSPYRFGYWNFDFDSDAMVFDYLLWADAETNPARVGIDAFLRGFSATLRDGSTQSLQNCEAMKYLELDCGEEIIAMWTSIEHWPTAVCLVTNKGRQLVGGEPSLTTANGWNHYVAPAGWKICGLYGAFGAEGNIAIGALYLPLLSSTPVGASNNTGERIVDDARRLVEPSAWPSEWVETGEVLGYRAEHASNHDQEACGVSWIDLTKSVSSLTAILSHPHSRLPTLSLVSLTFAYGDGTRATVGIAEISELAVNTKGAVYKREHMDCGCTYQQSKFPEVDGPGPEAHYLTKAWDVGGKRITEVRVWGDTRMDGVEFATADNKTFRLGQCDGEIAGTMVEPRGLKALMGRCRSNVSYFRDVAIYGIQALR